MINVQRNENLRPFIKTIIKYGADVRLEKNALLRAATCFGEKKLIELLFCHGADPNFNDDHYNFLFMEACETKRSDIIQLFIDNCALISNQKLMLHVSHNLLKNYFDRDKYKIFDLLLSNGLESINQWILIPHSAIFFANKHQKHL